MKGNTRAPSTGRIPRAGLTALVSIASYLVSPLAANAQSVAQRTPNLTNGWTPVRGVVQFNFTHRFDISDAPLRKITNTPTFHVATGIVGPVSMGFIYGSNSDLVPAYPNEWEWFARWSALSQVAGAPFDANIHAGWNVAAESFDTELTASRDLGRVRLLVAGRAFHHAFYRDEARYAVAGGAAFQVSPWLTIAGDYAALTDRSDNERPVWGAGLQLTVPSTPHSMSIHAGNVGTASLEGASRGSHTRWGFEYPVPITLARFGSTRAQHRPAEGHTPTERGAANGTPTRTADTVVITIRNFKFVRDKITVNPGDVVVWRNLDPVEHALQAEGGVFESPLIEPRRTFSYRFDTPGKFSYYCKPHPFMKAEVNVREAKP
jgi:plastocyanin